MFRPDVDSTKRIKGSLADLKKRVPQNVLDALLSRIGLTEEQLKDVSFTFFKDASSGSYTQNTHVKTGRVVHGVNIDEHALKTNRQSTHDWKHWHAGAVQRLNPFYYVIAHELTHLKQYLEGRMKGVVRGGQSYTYWEGKTYLDDPEINSPSTTAQLRAYRELPWEKEADTTAARVVSDLISLGMINERKFDEFGTVISGAEKIVEPENKVAVEGLDAFFELLDRLIAA